MSAPTIPLPISNLLSFTQSHLRHHEKLIRATGGNFNLFQVLGIGHYEVKTHSPILTELLNAKGSHGQGAEFLKLFLKQFGIASDQFDAERSTATPEYYLGVKTDNSGGRIDIVVRDESNRRIFIENKIYAAEQENQTTRYLNSDDKAILFYLTLFGDSPKNLSKEQLDAKRCICISYEIGIRDWLIECRKLAVCLPGIREVISQYIALIEELTHQSTTQDMNKELINEIISSPDKLEALFTLRHATAAVQAELVNRLNSDLNKMPAVPGLKKSGELESLGGKYDGVDYTSPDLEKLNLKVRLEFDMSGYRSFFYGFRLVRDGEECPARDAVRELFRQHFPYTNQTTPWPAWCHFEDPYRDWNHSAFEDIRSGKLAENIKDKLEKLSAISRQLCDTASSTLTTAPPEPLLAN